jgi:hypothetical protein
MSLDAVSLFSRAVAADEEAEARFAEEELSRREKVREERVSLFEGIVRPLGFEHEGIEGEVRFDLAGYPFLELAGNDGSTLALRLAPDLKEPYVSIEKPCPHRCGNRKEVGRLRQGTAEPMAILILGQALKHPVPPCSNCQAEAVRKEILDALPMVIPIVQHLADAVRAKW